jgi:hypothetical protein
LRHCGHDRRIAVLKQRLFKQNHAADVFGQTGRGGQQGAVSAAVGFAVFKADRLKAFADGAGRFVGRQQPGAGCRQQGSGAGQFVAKVFEGHGSALPHGSPPG